MPPDYYDQDFEPSRFHTSVLLGVMGAAVLLVLLLAPAQAVCLVP